MKYGICNYKQYVKSNINGKQVFLNHHLPTEGLPTKFGGILFF